MCEATSLDHLPRLLLRHAGRRRASAPQLPRALPPLAALPPPVLPGGGPLPDVDLDVDWETELRPGMGPCLVRLGRLCAGLVVSASSMCVGWLERQLLDSRTAAVPLYACALKRLAAPCCAGGEGGAQQWSLARQACNLHVSLRQAQDRHIRNLQPLSGGFCVPACLHAGHWWLWGGLRSDLAGSAGRLLILACLKRAAQVLHRGMGNTPTPAHFASFPSIALHTEAGRRSVCCCERWLLGFSPSLSTGEARVAVEEMAQPELPFGASLPCVHVQTPPSPSCSGGEDVTAA